jgi:three-Cys-motif partner protein
LFLFEGPSKTGAPKKLRIPIPRTAVEDARQFGGWTVSKLDLLEFYFRLYRRVAGNGTYIDGFAGTGSIRVTGQEVERPGSVSIALRSGAFKQLFLYERHRKAKALELYLADHFPTKDVDRCTVTPGDFNTNVRQHLAQELIPPDRPCFAFLDPNATDLDWSTVESLAAYKGAGNDGRVLKIELFVLFNSHQALMRLLPRSFEPSHGASPSAKTMDRVMGGRAAWWDLYERGASPGAFANRYAERLHTELGYGAALPHLILDPVSKRPQYYMIHAGDHEAAFSFMRWAERESGRERYETPRLFGP